MTATPQVSDQSTTLNFDNRFVRDLPADTQASNQRRQVFGACYSRVYPAPVKTPETVIYSPEMAATLGLSADYCESREFAQVFSGNRLMPGMEPFAMCYGGHQFGHWAGQLGDGRVINLGEIVNDHNERWILQLKGAGETPYSRNADGLAVLRSSLREFLCSEAMYHLGVPTTRALSLVLTGQTVVRDMFYDGHPKPEPGAICCRVAPSFLRLGNFQIFAARNEINVLRQLVDYTIYTDFPHLGEPSPEVYVRWFEEVCRLNAQMIMHWMRVGFVHGVLNTDNMSILGLTIDYGPYGWLENVDPAWTPNTTDAQGRRYCFGNQPYIGQWNLVQFANAIVPLIGHAEPLQEALKIYVDEYEKGFQRMMADKLGWRKYEPESDCILVERLQELLQQVETDMTLFYRGLADLKVDMDRKDGETLVQCIEHAYYNSHSHTREYRERMQAWLKDYVLRVRRDGFGDEQRREKMNRVNPKYVLRNYLSQLATDKTEQGDFTLVHELLDVLRRPYDEQPDYEKYAAKRPDWARNRPGCSMLSCSS